MILAGEDAENGQRKDWSISERVAIGRALETELANRRGTNQYVTKEDVGMRPQAQTGEKTRAFAALKSGIGSDRTYRKAKDIVDRGAPELIKAVDEKKLTINEAGDGSRRDQAGALSHGAENLIDNKGFCAVAHRGKWLGFGKMFGPDPIARQANLWRGHHEASI